MKSCFVVLLVVVCVAVAEEENCFEDGVLDKQKKETYAKMNEPVVKICKEGKEDMSDEELKDCIDEKREAASKECEAESGSDWKKKMKCVSKKLGIVWDFKIADYKTKMVGLALPDKKKAVEDAITSCEKLEGMKAMGCLKMKMGAVCPDVKKSWTSHGNGGRKGGNGGRGRKGGNERK